MTSTMYMSSHSVSESSGGPSTCGHVTMACSASGYLRWCTPRGGGASVYQNQCENRAIFARFRCIFAFTMAPQTQGKPAVGIGHLVGHRGTVMSQKRAISLRRYPDFNFLEFLKMLLPFQLFETSLFWPKPYICAPIFARFLLPIQKFPYRLFAKGTTPPPQRIIVPPPPPPAHFSPSV